MRTKLLNDAQGQRTYSIVLAKDDEVLAALHEFVLSQRVTAAQFTAIGAFKTATLGYFDWESKDYLKIAVNAQMEVASLLGDVALGADGAPSLHIHCVLSGRDGGAKAGHLLGATVRPTLEVVLTENPRHLRKRHDPESGLALIDPAAPE